MATPTPKSELECWYYSNMANILWYHRFRVTHKWLLSKKDALINTAAPEPINELWMLPEDEFITNLRDYALSMEEYDTVMEDLPF